MSSRVPTVQDDGTLSQKMFPAYLRTDAFNDALAQATSDAVTQADQDAQGYANTAQTNAEQAAATDATNKANAAAAESVPLTSKGQANGVPANDANLNTVLGGDGTWNGGHIVLGAMHLWIDGSGELRIKNGAPTSAGDGASVGSQS